MTILDRWTRIRLVACGVGFMVLFVGIGSRAYNLQIRDQDKLRGLAEDQYLKDIEVPPRRGRILDRNGSELASTTDLDSVFVNPRQLPDPGGAARRLASTLGVDRADLEKRFGLRRFFTWVKRRVSPEESAAARALDLPGLDVQKEPQRVYPNRSLGATVMGHAGGDGRGLDGIELTFDEALRGKPTIVTGVRDALGRELFVDGAVDTRSSAGSDVVLTIDRYLQFVTERALGDGVKEHNGKGGAAIVMDPETGEVLALAAVPTYDPNQPAMALAQGARNRAITDVYEPGSTMKVFTIAAALDARVVTPSDRFDCQMGSMKVGKYTIHDTHGYGLLDVADVFKHSSNICTAKIARRLGRERLEVALRNFGFGRRTGITLPGERSGLIRPSSRWGEIGFATVAFGQGMTVTPLQLVAGVAAVAGGGIYRPPTIALRVVRPDGRIEPVPQGPSRRVMSETASRQMVTIMQGVTGEGGTAPAAGIPGYPVGGKTGTAQKVSGGRYDPDKWVASFVGFAPADRPRIVVAVVIDEPHPVHLGGKVAAPIFRSITEQALKYLHIPPTDPAMALAATGRDKGAGKGEVADERPGSDLALVADDDDAVVVSGAPPFGEPGLVPSGPNGGPGQTDSEGLEQGPMAHAGVGGAPAGDGDLDAMDEPAADEPGGIEVPRLTGLTIGQAVRQARDAGLELEVVGSGRAVAQRPAAGRVARGSVVRVTFATRARDP